MVSKFSTFIYTCSAKLSIPSFIKSSVALISTSLDGASHTILSTSLGWMVGGGRWLSTSSSNAAVETGSSIRQS